MNTLHIVGGTYHEYCQVPKSNELWGSGLRGAVALSSFVDIHYTSLIGHEDLEAARAKCELYEVESTFRSIEKTHYFAYYHPLSKPIFEEVDNQSCSPLSISEDCILYYGMHENVPVVNAKYLVYDPQSHVPFLETGSSAEHLALVLNRNEAQLFTGTSGQENLEIIGNQLLEENAAEVVVIKDGSNGALVFTADKIEVIPVFETAHVWPIGSGDIFSAVFAWRWMFEKDTPLQAAYTASKYTATYCSSRVFPLPRSPLKLQEVQQKDNPNKIYLAAPFFTLSQVWLVDEIRRLLLEFQNEVFSPYHDVGFIKNSREVADKDLMGLDKCNTVFAVLDGNDPGTIFEIGYAISNGKRVIVLAEEVPAINLVMFEGTGCLIIKDLATAIYTASW